MNYFSMEIFFDQTQKFLFLPPEFQRAFNSVGLECHLDRVEVTGSNPVMPTNVLVPITQV